jgi:hypothetical protein
VSIGTNTYVVFLHRGCRVAFFVYNEHINRRTDMFLRMQIAIAVARKLMQVTGMGIHDACRIVGNRYNVDASKVYRELTH